jgi:hypothetical protein
MSKDLIKIRNPSIYHGGSVVPRNRTPFEKADDVFCPYRNATTTPYQTFSPYRSTTSNLSDLVNTASIKCGEDGEYESRHIYKCHEDIHGNTYLLFKHDIPDTITNKRNALGSFHIIDAEGVEFEVMFGTLVIPQGETVKDVQVFYDKVIIITGDGEGGGSIWLGESGSRNFFNITYKSYVQTTFSEGVVYIIHDPDTANIYDISKFDGKDLIPVTTTPLADAITSSGMVVKDNRIEIVYINTACGFLTNSEYNLIDDEWYGFRTIPMQYEIIGVHDDSKKWYVYYESNTFPNRVGGLCIDFNFEKPPVVTSSECGGTEDIYIEIPEIPETGCDPDVEEICAEYQPYVGSPQPIEFVTLTGSLNTLGGGSFTGTSTFGIITAVWNGVEGWWDVTTPNEGLLAADGFGDECDPVGSHVGTNEIVIITSGVCPVPLACDPDITELCLLWSPVYDGVTTHPDEYVTLTGSLNIDGGSFAGMSSHGVVSLDWTGSEWGISLPYEDFFIGLDRCVPTGVGAGFGNGAEITEDACTECAIQYTTIYGVETIGVDEYPFTMTGTLAGGYTGDVDIEGSIFPVTLDWLVNPFGSGDEWEFSENGGAVGGGSSDECDPSGTYATGEYVLSTEPIP